MNEKNTIEVSVICGDCKKEFSIKVQYYYDSNSVDQQKLDFGVVTCPFCGAERYSGLPFLFFSREEHILYTVFTSASFNCFEKVKKFASKLLEEHLSNSSFKEQAEIKNADRRYVERELFQKVLGFDDRDNYFILGQRSIRFTPPPSISLNNKYFFLGNHKNYNLSKNDIAFSSNGLSIFQKNIIDETCNRMNNNGFVVNLIDVEEEQRPSLTCGFLDIALTVGSIVIMPILVNVISDVISDFRHKKDKNELALKKNDDIRVTISEDGTKKPIVLKVIRTVLFKQ